jgi:hypothetical protein
MAAENPLIKKMNSSDIIRLMEKLGVPESMIKYGNNSLIFPTICHNEMSNDPSHKLYYYEATKRFYCYTNCKSMSVFDFIIKVYQTRGYKIEFREAYNILDEIVSKRIKNGFAILSNPKPLVPDKIDKNWEEQLPVYNHHILECFTQQPRFLDVWMSEGIDYDVLVEFGVRFDMVRNRIVFPILDRNGRLVGIRVRNFNQEDLDSGRKYMPLWHNEELYNCPKMMVVYGYYQNKAVIKKLKEVIVFEAEKSVLKYGSCFTQNKSVAVGGSSFSQYHGIILKDAGVTKIVLAFDNDYSEDGDKYYGLKKMIKEAKKIQDMGFEVEIIYDWDQEYLGNKDAPIDLGRTVYSKLYRERKKLAEVIELYEEDTNEVPTTEQEF